MRTCKYIFLIIIPFIFSTHAFSQDTAISQTENYQRMPHISTPTLGSQYYRPGQTNITNRDSNIQKTEDTEEEQKATSKSDTKNQNLTTEIFNTLFDSDSSTLSNRLSAENFHTLFSNKNYINIISPTPVPHSAKILRFNINGQDILESCKKIYFSDQENDGTFLVTGDRRYLLNNIIHDETFYLLFKADGNCGSQKGYNVEPAIVQDYKNDLSPVYKLAKREDLKARKTGNLVVLSSISSDYNLDMLLDLGE